MPVQFFPTRLFGELPLPLKEQAERYLIGKHFKSAEAALRQENGDGEQLSADFYRTPEGLQVHLLDSHSPYPYTFLVLRMSYF